ncbi:MAG: alpha/beta hydrolase [Cyanobacteria bacterium P01_D01_bin.73]
MFPDFLPAAAQDLTDAESIDFAQKIQRVTVTVPLGSGGRAIATSYIQQGTPTDQPPILLIHGFDSSLMEYRRLLPLLAERREVWAVDLLTFGFTERPENLTFSAAIIKAHLHQFWQDVIGGRSLFLIGASMGGAVAQDFAVTYPDAVEKLVLLDSAGFVGKPLASRFLIAPIGKLATNFLSNPKVRNGIGKQAYYDPEQWATPEAYRCGALHVTMPQWSEALISFTQQGGYTIQGDHISQIQQPTLVLWGDRDQILGTATARKFADTLPSNTLVWVLECGHVPHLEQAPFTSTQILDWLNESD